jgi:heme-degrading monooxygenase HmoA
LRLWFFVLGLSWARNKEKAALGRFFYDSKERTMTEFANTPIPPYYAVIFTSLRTEGDQGYATMATRMVELAQQQPGFLGAESARDGIGITVSYWQDLAAIKAWKANSEHLDAQRQGRATWYSGFKVRIAKVEREYGFE